MVPREKSNFRVGGDPRARVREMGEIFQGIASENGLQFIMMSFQKRWLATQHIVLRKLASIQEAMVDTTCGTPWPAAFGDTVTADFSFGADADAHLLWCAFHDNGAGAYIDACRTAFGRSTASVLQYAASAAASRRCIYWRFARAAHHNPLPALAQCHATVPKLLEARRRLWMGNNLVCASLCPRLRRSTNPRGRDIDPGLRRRPPGRRFVLHRTFGPRLRYAASNPALCDLCCCCCAPPRRYPGTCRTTTITQALATL